MTDSATQVNCGKVRRVVLEGGPRLTHAEVEHHLRQCASCQAFVAGEASFAATLAAQMAPTTASVDVRRRLFDALADGRRRRLRWGRWVAAVAAIAAVAMLSLRLLAPAVDPLTAVVEDFARLQGVGGLRTNNRVDATRWLTPQVDVAVIAPAWPRATLVGARICPMPAGRGAVLEYQVEGEAVGYYILPMRQGTAAGLQFSHVRGYSVIAWHDDDVWHVVISALSVARFRDLIPFNRFLAPDSGLGRPGGSATS